MVNKQFLKRYDTDSASRMDQKTRNLERVGRSMVFKFPYHIRRRVIEEHFPGMKSCAPVERALEMAMHRSAQEIYEDLRNMDAFSGPNLSEYFRVKWLLNI